LVNEERQGIKLDHELADLDAANIVGTNHTEVLLQMSCSWWASNVLGEVCRTAKQKAQENEDTSQEAED